MGAPSDAIRHASRRIREEVPNARGTPLDLRAIVEKFNDDSKACDVLSAVRRAWHTTTGEPSNKLSERELVRVDVAGVRCVRHASCATCLRVDAG